jgi:magnesium-transporting ATPase (P-type)
MMVVNSFGMDYAKRRSDCFDERKGDILFPFSSARKCMSVLLLNRENSKSARLFTKVIIHDLKILSWRLSLSYLFLRQGAAEVILGRCTFFLSKSGEKIPMTEHIKSSILEIILNMAKETLRAVALGEFD